MVLAKKMLNNWDSGAKNDQLGFKNDQFRVLVFLILKPDGLLELVLNLDMFNRESKCK